MGALASVKANLRTLLAAAPASLTNLPEDVAFDDLPDSLLDKGVFKVSTEGADGLLDNGVFGGGHKDIDATVLVEWARSINLDEEAITDTMDNDAENIETTVVKASNRYASGGTTQLNARSVGWTFEKKSDVEIRGVARFVIRVRRTVDLT